MVVDNSVCPVCLFIQSSSNLKPAREMGMATVSVRDGGSSQGAGDVGGGEAGGGGGERL